MPPKRKRSGNSKGVGSKAKKAKTEEQKAGKDAVSTAKKGKSTAKARNAAATTKNTATATRKKAAPKKINNKFSLSSGLKDPTWSNALQDEMKKSYFAELEAKLAKDYSSLQIFPPQDIIFNALNLTPLDQVKVVILGQDPYHDDGQTHGLAFSVPQGIDIPPSLRNMYKELANDIKGFNTPVHGCLETWAKQGVLLLNTSLTVEAHKPNSHKGYGWQTFTEEVIHTVSENCPKVVFLLWGNFAHKKEKLVDTTKHVVLKDAHPSPLSFGKFQNCKCFSRANDALVKAGILPVDWTL